MTPLPKLIVLAVGTLGTVVAEVAAVQSSESVAEWALKNAMLLLAIVAGVMGYGALRSDVRHLQRDLEGKASSDRVDGIDAKLDLIHGNVQAIRDAIARRRP